MQRRRRRIRWRLPEFAVEQILAWADRHHQRMGRWPSANSGRIPGSLGEKWRGVDRALQFGIRGLPGGSSLARLLAEQRGVRNRYTIPPLAEAQILEWADRHRERTGRWPSLESGPIPGSFQENWTGVDRCLKLGVRGLAGGSSLSRLLAEQRGARNQSSIPALEIGMILAWADGHHARTGHWPGQDSGPIAAVPGECWRAVNVALYKGGRGLPGGSSLARLLETRRGVPNHANLPRLTERQILQWADEHYARTGRWPRQASGPVHGTRTEVWRNIDNALKIGQRGLGGGSSLAQLLERERGVRNQANLAPFTNKEILAWADAYHQRTGRWPRHTSGPIDGTHGETWALVDNALKNGVRGLRGGSSLARLLERRRGARNLADLPPLTYPQILAWADGHHRRTGGWPRRTTGPIAEAPGEVWANVDGALKSGGRGLRGGMSLALLLSERRGMRSRINLAQLTEEHILAWADAHHRRTGAWPTAASGPILDAPGETWAAVNAALRLGQRGLPGGTTLPRLLAAKRGKRNHLDAPRLTTKQINAWAVAHHRRTGQWPTADSGPILEAPGESWMAVDGALRAGRRGLRGMSSLARLLKKRR